jgi:glycine cleavage system transcriptional repressor
LHIFYILKIIGRSETREVHLNQTVVLTGVGRDRVGIVAELADALFELGCNLLDSSMTLLRGEFAVILMVTLPESITLEVLSQRLKIIQERLGFTLHVRLLSEEELKSSDSTDAIYVISVYGADKPGIVSGVTRKLAALGVNITDVQTKRTTEKQSIFIMVLEVTVPANLNAERLTEELKATASSLAVDLSVREIEVVEL